MTFFYILTFGLVAGLGIVFAQTDRQNVMAHWDEQRCSLPVMVAGNMYQPVKDTRSGLEFAQENFTFCTKRIIKEVFTAALAPFVTVIGSQMDAANVVQEIMNGMRTMLGNFQRVFTDLIDGVFQRFMAVGFQLRHTYEMFLSAMQRAFAIATSTVFLGISMVVGIENTYKFIIKVVVIIIGILVGLMILLFLVLIPVLPVIFTAIAALTAIGVGGLDAGAFCFTPITSVELITGESCQMKDLKLGDTLKNGAIIEGILRVSGENVPLYQLGTTIVSGDHLVLYAPLKKWILVKDHPEATPQIKHEPLLICLNTSSHTIPIGEHVFRDWEEMPENRPDLQEEWGKMIADLLDTPHTDYADAYCILSGSWLVHEKRKGEIRLDQVQIGDSIRDYMDYYTKVIGVYSGCESVLTATPYWYSESVWWLRDGEWAQRHCTIGKEVQDGFHLITDSGTFLISNGKKINQVRDFTEVGWNRISQTYQWMQQALASHKKYSLTRS